jgi:hypothetical protein
VSLCTKPQALPFVLPFAAWFWATGYARDGVRGGVLELVRTGLVGLATLVVLWLPFIPHGGPGDYLSNLAYYQNEIFSTLSLRAWNAWSLVQDLAVGGQFVVDDVPIIGPITMRHIGYAVTGLLSLTIGLAIIRDPRPRTLILGLSASVLAFFCFMTQMHERYAYAAVILLILLLPERRVAWSWVALATVFSLNLIAAIPPDLEPGSVIPVTGIVGIIGALAMIAIFVATLRLVRSEPGHPGDGSV